jgi:hypothetical protein
MRLQRRILLIVLSMGSLVGAAATQPAKLGAAERAPGGATAAAAVSLRDRTPSTDDLLVAVANQVPGFGGMFIGADGLLRIYLLDPRQSAAAQAAIAAVFGRDRVSLAGAQTLQARYGFTQLKAWHDRHRLLTLAIPGVVSTGIDKASNRLRIGVQNRRAIPAVQRQLDALAIPLAAAEIVVTQPMENEDTLQDRHRPLLGGLQINTQTLLGCTLSFLAVRQAQAGFVTCSHCTIVQGGVEGTIFHQPTVSGDANQIGVEVADPLYLTGSDCPSGRACRLSDSAFAARKGGPSQAAARPSGDLGHIAYVDPALNIVTAYQIIGKIATPIDGEVVARIGKTTGYSSGQITQTCTDFNVFLNGVDTGKTNLCQSAAQAPSALGDSGSPVFTQANVPSLLPPVILYGIQWGGAGGTVVGFSPISAVEQELGQLKTFLSEAGANSPPEVRIRNPLDGAAVGVGGLNAVSLQADIVDYEGCCLDITWQSDKDGLLGHGATLEFTFTTPGTRTVTVTATDNDNATASDSISLTASTTQPSVFISQPPPFQTLYTGFLNAFQGTSFDPNEAFFSMPCADLTWTSSDAGDPFPVTGCTPQMTFQTTGQRNITLTGTDSFGLTAATSVAVTVIDVPPTAAPMVTILNPHDSGYLPAYTAVTLSGKVQDPANQGPLNYQWVVIDGGVTTVLSTGSVASGGLATFTWTPKDNVSFSCGGRDVTLELDATNPSSQTGSASVSVHIGYSTC